MKIKAIHSLVIQDNPGDYQSLQEYLQMGQLPVEKIIHADSISEDPPFINDNNFDNPLLNLTRPGSAGIESVIVLNRLLLHTPIVVFSGSEASEIAVEFISVGAQDYLAKGEYDEKLLPKTIQYGIARNKLLKKIKERNEWGENIRAHEKERNKLGKELLDNMNQILVTA
ncbi:MAG: response regulator [Chitinophagaceae bacterium]|nr:response regulator [Chitinophagaceae bacterium]